MCRNIRTLFNFVPPVTTEEIRAASLQFVRKISGFNKPSKANEAVFQAAVDEITEAAIQLIRSLGTTAPPKRSRTRGRKGEGPQRPKDSVLECYRIMVGTGTDTGSIRTSPWFCH